MPLAQLRRLSETLFHGSLNLLGTGISLAAAVAIPVITQEFARTPTPTTTAPSKLTSKETFDIVFIVLFYLFAFGCLDWAGIYPFPPFVFVKWLIATLRPIWDTVLSFRLGARFRRAADDIVGSYNARANPQAGDVDTPPTAVPASSQLRAQNVERDPSPTAILPLGVQVPPAATESTAT